MTAYSTTNRRHILNTSSESGRMVKIDSKRFTRHSVSSIVSPSPLTRTGLVQTFQNSVTFWVVRQSVCFSR